MDSIIKFFILIVCSSCVCHAQQSQFNSSFAFEENKGQFPDHVLYRFEALNKIIYVEERGIKFHLYDEVSYDNQQGCAHTHCDHEQPHHAIAHHVFFIEFLGASLDLNTSLGRIKSNSYKNYLIGRDSSKWARKVHSYQGLTIPNAYPNIDLELDISEKGIKYQWIVHPGGDPAQIKQRYHGLIPELKKDKSIHYPNKIEPLKEIGLYVYQSDGDIKKEIESNWRLTNNTLQYDVQSYDQESTLIIDPILVFSTYSGSTSDNWGTSATPGANGELYGAGVTFGPGYPTTTGAFQTDFRPSMSFFNRSVDVSITKYSTDGTSVIYSTYLGGDRQEMPHSIIENSRGELVIMGTTSSTDFPLSNNAFQTILKGGEDEQTTIGTYSDGSDIYVTVLSADGSQLIGSSYIGGSGNDGLNIRAFRYNYGDEGRGEVIVDEEDNIYVASCTRSTDFPVISTLSGQNLSEQNACLFSFDRSMSRLRSSMVYGGSNIDAGYSVKLLPAGHVLMVGGTLSSDLLQVGAIKSINNWANPSGYYLILNENLSEVVRSSYYGDDGYNQIYFASIGPDSSIYLAGQTEFDLDQSANTYANGTGQFITRLSPLADSVVMGSNFGNFSVGPDISITAFMVDRCGRAFLSGWGGRTGSFRSRGYELSISDLEITDDAIYSTTDGDGFYLLALESELSEIVFGSYYGDPTDESGDHVDGGTSRFSEDGVIYQSVCASCGGTSNFPTTPDAVSQTNNASNCNMATFKLDFQLENINASAAAQEITENCTDLSARFRNNSVGAERFEWDFGDGSRSTEFEPRHQYDSVGVYFVRLIAFPKRSCLPADTATIRITFNRLGETSSDSLLTCDIPSLDLSSSFQRDDRSYIWNTGDTTPTLQVAQSGWYAVTAMEGACEYIDSFYTEITLNDLEIPDSFLCDSFSIDVMLPDSAANIEWSTGETGSSITITQADDYVVSYSLGACPYIDSFSISSFQFSDFELELDSSICDGDTAQISLVPSSPAFWFYELNLDNKLVPLNTTEFLAFEEGWYFISASIDNNCSDEIRDSFYLEVIQVSGDTILQNYCDTNTITIDSPTGAAVLWNGEFTQESYTISESSTIRATYHIQDCPVTNLYEYNLNVTPQYSVISDTSLCGDEPSTAKIEGDYFENTDLKWSNGATTPEISITEAGIYIIQASHHGPCPLNFVDSVVVQRYDPLLPLETFNSCAAEQYELELGNTADSYIWSTGDTGNAILVEESGTYEVEYTIGPCTFSDSARILLAPQINFSILGDSVICESESTQLSLKVEEEELIQFPELWNIEWSTGDQSPAIRVSEENLYTAAISDDRNCARYDSFYLRVVPLLRVPDIRDTLVCGEESSLEVNLVPYVGNLEVEWQDGYQGPIRDINEVGNYSFEITTECQDISRSIFVDFSPYTLDNIPIYIPNAFTPNGDMVNDEYKIEKADDLVVDQFQLLIFDRWGQKVFESNDINESWDGQVDTREANLAVYPYIMKADIMICGEIVTYRAQGDIHVQY